MDQTPQLENGYTRIANKILEEISKIKLNGTQYRIILAIWRYTYGFQRKEHSLSLTFLSEATGIDKNQIKRELDKLIELKIIVVTKEATFNKSRVIAFNKYSTVWELEYSKKSTVSENNKSTVRGLEYSTVRGLEYQERKYIKENIKENIIVLTPTEHEILQTLSTVENYPLDREKDLDMIKRLIKRYPHLDILESIKDWATYKLDKPLKDKDNARSQINTSCKNYVKWGRNLKTTISKSNDKSNANKMDLDHNYDIDELERKLLKKSRGG